MSILKDRPPIVRVGVTMAKQNDDPVNITMDIRVASIDAMCTLSETDKLGAGVVIVGGREFTVTRGYVNLYTAWRNWVEDELALHLN